MTRPDLPFLQALEGSAPDFVEAVAQLLEVNSKPGDGLDRKTRLLFTMALDIAHGFTGGAQRVADQARAAGATDADIVDVLKICFVNAVLQRLANGCEVLGERAEEAERPDVVASRTAAPAFTRILRPTAGDFVDAVVKLLVISPTPGSSLPESTKRLFSMALDISMGFPEFAKEMARMARDEGATEAEIVDVVKLAGVNGGLQRLFVGTQVLEK